MENVAEHPHSRRPIGRWLVLALVAGFLALLAYGLASKGRDDRIDRALASGRPAAAPSFSLELLDRGSLPPVLERSVSQSLGDGELALAELRGTPVVLNMWASWCTPCRAEAAPLQDVWRALGPRGVLFLGLDIQDVTSDALKFARDHGITYPSVRDPGREVPNRYGATGVPETFFIDVRGRVVGHVIGAVSARQLRNGALAARAGRVAGKGAGGESFDLR